MPADLDSHFGVHAQALVLRSQRAEILGANLANADTPNYKAKDFDFATVLREQQNGTGFSLQRTHPSHLVQPGDTRIAPGAIQFRTPQQASINGNTVETHIEQGKYSENAVQYLASLELLNGKISGLMRAIRGE